MHYELIGSPRSRTFRVLWMLEELGVVYEYDPAPPHSPQIKAVNPSGKVPALKVSGEVIVDSVAIVQYLADHHGRFTHPAGTIERARQDSFTQFAIDDLEGPCWNHSKHSFVLPEALRVEEAKPAFTHDFRKALEVLDARLGDNAHVMGDEFTVPDLLIGHLAGWSMQIGFEWPDGRLTDYVERVRTRPAFLRAMEIRNAA